MNFKFSFTLSPQKLKVIGRLMMVLITMQAIPISVELLEALCFLLCCWDLRWLHSEETCQVLGVEDSQEVER